MQNRGKTKNAKCHKHEPERMKNNLGVNLESPKKKKAQPSPDANIRAVSLGRDPLLRV